MEIAPIYGTRALKLELSDEKILAVADLHLGLSAELSNKGIEIPSQIPEARDRLMDFFDRENFDRLFLLGDVKHNIPVTSWEEWENLPDFFADLSREVDVEIVPGNHDGDIDGLIPRDVVLHEVGGTTIGEGKIGFVHGHAWPNPELFGAEVIVMGHNHPTIEFKDEIGGRVNEPAWVRAELKVENLPDDLRKEVSGEDPEVMVIPAFNRLVGGGAVNDKIPEDLLGPIFNAGAINLDEAKIYLIDGTFLGKLENLEGLSGSS